MQPGESINDRWIIERLADSGGMGSVYRAKDCTTGRPVALKLFHRGDAQALERFKVEVAALAGAEHDSVVRYVEHGMLDPRTPFLVMEWIEGESLMHRLWHTGVTLHELIALGVRIAGALALIHARGIVHRDLKPSNVMLPGGTVASAKLVDFGIARLQSARMLTASGARIGTLEYMAPEQIRSSRRVDGRADVFALGCILFECATGRRPYVANDDISILARIVLEDAPRARGVRPLVPEPLDRFLARLLERNPLLRPSSDGLGAELALLAAALGGVDLPAAPSKAHVEAQDRIAEDGLRTTVEQHGKVVGTTTAWSPPPLDRGLGTRAPQLPSPQSALVGRGACVRDASAALHPRGAMLSLWGAAGIGKTRVAIEVARSFAAGDLDGAAYCDLRDAGDVEGVLRAASLTLGVVPAVRSSEEVAAAIGRALDARRDWLFVLDHVDAVAPAVGALVAAWRAAAPNARFLLSSRERLRVPGTAIEIGPLTAEDAAGLFVARANAVRDSRVDTIVRALDNHPLAVELAAARVGVLGLDGLVERLHRPLELLGSTGTREHPLTMRDALEWSWAQLSFDEKRALACASVFRGGFTARAAEAVLATPSALDLLQSLRDKSLLTSSVRGDAGPPRLALWGAVRDLASTKLDELGLTSEAQTRHGEYYATAARTLAREVSTSGSLTALTAIATEFDNLLAAAEHALATRANARALEALLALDPVLTTRGPFGRHLELLDAALGDTTGVDPRLVADARQARARVLSTRGRFKDARADLAAALDAARSRGDAEAEALAMLDVGVMHHSAHELDDAKAAYERVLSLGVANMRAEGRALGNLGAVAHDMGRLNEAYASYIEAFALFESLGDQQNVGLALMNLAVIDEERGKLDDARGRFQRALGCLETVRDRRVTGIALSNLGTLELERGDWSAAVDAHERARAILADVGDARSEALCLGRLGAALACAGRIDEAAAALARGERLAARRDPAARDTVKMLRAFLDVARARAAMTTGETDVVRTSVAAADARVREAQGRSASGDTPLADRSDDVRAALRVLRPMLTALYTGVPA